jgi:hypothetical protein
MGSKFFPPARLLFSHVRNGNKEGGSIHGCGSVESDTRKRLAHLSISRKKNPRQLFRRRGASAMGRPLRQARGVLLGRLRARRATRSPVRRRSRPHRPSASRRPLYDARNRGRGSGSSWRPRSRSGFPRRRRRRTGTFRDDRWSRSERRRARPTAPRYPPSGTTRRAPDRVVCAEVSPRPPQVSPRASRAIETTASQKFGGRDVPTALESRRTCGTLIFRHR